MTQIRGDHQGHTNVRSVSEAIKVKQHDKSERQHHKRKHKPGYHESRLLAEGYGRSNYRPSFVESIGERYRTRGDFTSFHDMVANRHSQAVLSA